MKRPELSKLLRPTCAALLLIDSRERPGPFFVNLNTSLLLFSNNEQSLLQHLTNVKKEASCWDLLLRTDLQVHWQCIQKSHQVSYKVHQLQKWQNFFPEQRTLALQSLNKSSEPYLQTNLSDMKAYLICGKKEQFVGNLRREQNKVMEKVLSEHLG